MYSWEWQGRGLSTGHCGPAPNTGPGHSRTSSNLSWMNTSPKTSLCPLYSSCSPQRWCFLSSSVLPALPFQGLVHLVGCIVRKPPHHLCIPPLPNTSLSVIRAVLQKSLQETGGNKLGLFINTWESHLSWPWSPGWPPVLPPRESSSHTAVWACSHLCLLD